jgi:hypothetical protein
MLWRENMKEWDLLKDLGQYGADIALNLTEVGKENVDWLPLPMKALVGTVVKFWAP